jgi:hypothetical protein
VKIPCKTKSNSLLEMLDFGGWKLFNLLKLRIYPRHRGSNITCCARIIAASSETQLDFADRRLAPGKNPKPNWEGWFWPLQGLVLGRKTSRFVSGLGSKSSGPEQISPAGLAVREGFEPSIGFHLYTRSRRAPSTTRPPHQRTRAGRGERRNIAMARPATSERERSARSDYVGASFHREA